MRVTRKTSATAATASSSVVRGVATAPATSTAATAATPRSMSAWGPSGRRAAASGREVDSTVYPSAAGALLACAAAAAAGQGVGLDGLVCRPHVVARGADLARVVEHRGGRVDRDQREPLHRVAHVPA